MAATTHGKVIANMAQGVFVTLEKIKPAGALQVRKQVSGAVAFYWRFSLGDSSHRVLIGTYSPMAPPKSLEPTKSGQYSIQAAIRAAEALATKHTNAKPVGGFPALQDAEIAAKREALAKKREASHYTLKKLLEDYVEFMQARGRSAHREARSIFTLHVFEAWPNIAALPANSVTAEQIADMMRKLHEAGKGRTSNKLRSYVRAAYQTARAAKTKPDIPLQFKSYNIGGNPAAETEPDQSQNNTAKAPLATEELRLYWQKIKALPGFRGAALRLHLLTGGQRIEQLVKLLSENVKDETITLFDGKGRPGKPARPHAVPLIPLAARALADCMASLSDADAKGETGKFAISTDGGVTHLAATTLSGWANEVAGADIPKFQTKRIRSGVATELARLKVSDEISNRLQSHGIAGVQARHYNGYEYMDEKRQALEILYRHLERKESSKVVSLRKA